MTQVKHLPTPDSALDKNCDPSWLKSCGMGFLCKPMVHETRPHQILGVGSLFNEMDFSRKALHREFSGASKNVIVFPAYWERKSCEDIMITILYC